MGPVIDIHIADGSPTQPVIFHLSCRRPGPTGEIIISQAVCQPPPDYQDNSLRYMLAMCRRLLEVSMPQRARSPAPSGCFGGPLAVDDRCTNQSQLYALVPVF